MQRLLCAEGYYKGRLDGINGPLTAAAKLEHEQATLNGAIHYGDHSTGNEHYIRLLLIPAQILARQYLSNLDKAGLTGRIISSTRTYAEQDILWQQGRSLPGAIVTNAMGGQSMHNFGLAWDVGIFSKGEYVSTGTKYDEAAEAGMIPGLIWGGNFRKFKDRPHYQVKIDIPVNKIREHFEAGTLEDQLLPCWKYI